MKTLGLITCRGGSKRLPGKNILPLGDKPLLIWTIESALASRLDKVAISTDDTEITLTALRHAGDKLLYIARPKELSQDDSRSVDAVRHALSLLSPFGRVMILQPTSPFRTAEDINNCLDMSSDHVVSVNPEGVRNAAIYLFKTELLEDPSFEPRNGKDTYTMPTERSLDINTLGDLEKARKLLINESTMGEEEIIPEEVTMICDPADEAGCDACQ